MPQIICENLTLGYDGKIVVENLNFTVNAGEYICIVGENGSGKSTLMKTMLNLKTPISGSVKFCDGVLHNEIGYLPQQTVAQKDFPASVREVVRSGFLNRCGLRPFYTKAEKISAEDNMQKLGVAHLAKRCYRELSGGEQRRVLLARALCAAKKIIMLDEAAAGLDPNAVNEMYELIAKINRDGMTAVVISHDIAASKKYATRILQLGENQGVTQGGGGGL